MALKAETFMGDLGDTGAGGVKTAMWFTEFCFFLTLSEYGHMFPTLHSSFAR